MNEHEYINMTNGINESFISEYRDITAKRGIRIKRIIRTGVAIAAALALMIPVGVFAHNLLTHRDKVSVYYTEDGVQKLEETGLTNGYSVENGQIRLTVDTQMCDGNFTQGVYTLTALTQDAKEHLESRLTKLVYADTGERIRQVGGGTEVWFGEANSEYELTIKYSYPLKNAYIDSNRPMRVEFYEYVETGETDGYGMIVVEDETYYHDIGFDLLTKPNVPTKTLYSEDGGSLTLSPYGVSRQDENWNGDDEDMDINSFKIISTDGERTEIDEVLKNSVNKNRDYSGSPETGSFTYSFGTMLDIDSISGVEINGVEYMAE